MIIICRRVWHMVKTVRPTRGSHYTIHRHLHHVHGQHGAHWASHLVCRALPLGLAAGGAAWLARPPVPVAVPAPAPVYAPAPAWLPPAAFLPAPGAYYWPAGVPAGFVVPPVRERCEHRHKARRRCEHRARQTEVPEPTGIAVLGMSILGLTTVRAARTVGRVALAPLWLLMFAAQMLAALCGARRNDA